MEALRRLSDDSLLAATSRRPEAFGVFYERHVAAVVSYLRSETNDTETALDLTAEVFAAALVAADRYRPGEAPARAWLIGISRNKLATFRRSHARDMRARRRLGIPPIAFADEALERVEELLDTMNGSYTGAMDQLTDVEKRAITARVFDERSYAEIAASAGVSQEVVRQRVSRGLARLAHLTRPGRGQ